MTTLDWRAQRFNRAADSYDKATAVQKTMASRLMELVPDDFHPRQILELGCGTGHLSEQLAAFFLSTPLHCTDLAPAMLEASQKRLGHCANISWSLLDARAPVGIRADLLASSAMVQWFPNLEHHFQAALDCTNPGGFYLLAGFSPGNLPELQQCLLDTGLANPAAAGHELAEAQELAQRTGWSVSRSRQASVQQQHPTAAEFLRDLSRSGATRPPGHQRLNRRTLQALLQAYTNIASTADGQVTSTWTPWYLLLQSPQLST